MTTTTTVRPSRAVLNLISIIKRKRWKTRRSRAVTIVTIVTVVRAAADFVALLTRSHNLRGRYAFRSASRVDRNKVRDREVDSPRASDEARLMDRDSPIGGNVSATERIRWYRERRQRLVEEKYNALFVSIDKIQFERQGPIFSESKGRVVVRGERRNNGEGGSGGELRTYIVHVLRGFVCSTV